jgi:hypothetical protein
MPIMETTTQQISKKIKKYKEKSDVIFLDVNDFLDQSNKVKKNMDTLIKLGESINESAFQQITNIHGCSTEMEKNFKAVAALMLILVEKSKSYHGIFAKHEFYKESLKSSLAHFMNVILEMEEAAEDILSNIDLNQDQEWSDLTNDLTEHLKNS